MTITSSVDDRGAPCSGSEVSAPSSPQHVQLPGLFSRGAEKMNTRIELLTDAETAAYKADPVETWLRAGRLVATDGQSWKLAPGIPIATIEAYARRTRRRHAQTIAV